MTEPAVTALALQLHGDRGPVFGPVDLEIEAGTLTLVQGPQGAGRTSLLLALAGAWCRTRRPTSSSSGTGSRRSGR